LRRTEQLWHELGGPGAPLCADAKAVKRRVDAALDADPEERRNHMKRKITYALAAAALAAALSGSALAVSRSLDAISAFFGGDRAPVEDYLDSKPRSVSDKNYTFTVDSSVSAGDKTYLTVTVTALNEETREFLFSDQFSDMDTFSIHPILDEAYTNVEQNHGAPSAVMGASWGVTPREAPDEDSLCFHLSIGYPGKAKAIKVRLGWMEEGKYVEIPVKYAPEVTVKLGGSGVGICGMETLEPGTLTIEKVILSPLTCKVITSNGPHNRGENTYPRILFRMADGSVRTQSQMMSMTDGGSIENDRYYEYNYDFNDVQDLEQITGIIAFDMEYPLDGSKPRAVEHDAALDPITVTPMESLKEGSGYTLSVRELTEKLGGTCVWDAGSGAVMCTYRGVSIVLRAGELTAAVDGEDVEMRFAPGVLDGKLCSDCGVFFDAWGLDGFVQRTAFYEQRQPDGSVPLVWHDWYIVP